MPSASPPETPDDFPRVLFVTPHAFNKTTGTGITFTNLFSGWPKDRIATVHDDSFPPSDDICERYFRLTPAEIRRRDLGLSALLSRRRHAGSDTPETPASVCRATPGGSLKVRARQALFGDGFPQTGVLTPRLAAWIEAFRPDLVFTIFGGIGMMELVGRIQDRFGVPLVVHFMDDWMSAQFRTGLFAPFQRRHMEALVKHLVERATVRLGICDAMCDAFEHRYGRPFAPFQNTVDVGLRADAGRDPGPVHDPVRVVYAGSVLPHAQLDSLADCCRAIGRLAESGRRIQLDIYGPESLVAPHRPRLEIHSSVWIHPPLTDDAVFFATLAAADILLMPSNFDDDTIRFIRYSMPTRVPAYLVSGTPILVYGPAHVAQVQYAKAVGWGLVIDRRDDEALAEGLARLASDAAIRRTVAATAMKTARDRHDAATVRRQFQATLAGAADFGV